MIISFTSLIIRDGKSWCKCTRLQKGGGLLDRIILLTIAVAFHLWLILHTKIIMIKKNPTFYNLNIDLWGVKWHFHYFHLICELKFCIMFEEMLIIVPIYQEKAPNLSCRLWRMQQTFIDIFIIHFPIHTIKLLKTALLRGTALL